MTNHLTFRTRLLVCKNEQQTFCLKTVEFPNVTNFKNSLPTFCVDVINLCPITQITLFSICFVTDHFFLCFLKLIVNWHGLTSVKQNTIKTYNHAKLNLPAAHVNDCSKVIVHELVKYTTKDHLFGCICISGISWINGLMICNIYILTIYKYFTN